MDSVYIYVACTLSSILHPFPPQPSTRSGTSSSRRASPCPKFLFLCYLAGFLFARTRHREWGNQAMANAEETKNGSTRHSVDESMPSPEEEEAAVKKKYGGIMPKKPPLISKDHERAYFDSADWALGKGAQPDHKPKSLVEALRPKLQPTHHQPLPSRKASYATSEGEDGAVAATEEAS